MTELKEIDPKSGKPILDKGIYFTFPSYPKFYAQKEYCGRAMSVEDYIAIVKATMDGKSHKLDGFISKKGDKYAMSLAIDDTGERLRHIYEARNPTSVICPKSGKPADDRGVMFLFPGYPGLACWKRIAGRELSAEDHLKILQADGQPVEFTDFISKKGKPFTAMLQYNKEENKIQLVFRDAPKQDAPKF